MNRGVLSGLDGGQLPALRGKKEHKHFFVAPDGSDGDDGLSWGTALLNIQTAVDKFERNESGTIYLSDGWHYVIPPLLIEDRHIQFVGQGITTKIKPAFQPAADVPTVKWSALNQSIVWAGMHHLSVDSPNIGEIAIQMIRASSFEHTMFSLTFVGTSGHKVGWAVDCTSKSTAIGCSFEFGWGGASRGVRSTGGRITMLGTWFESVDVGLDLFADAAITNIDPTFATTVNDRLITTPQFGFYPQYTEGVVRDQLSYRQHGATRDCWYFGAQDAAGTMTTQALVANRAYAYPFVSTRGGLVSAAAVNVTTLIASSNVRIGIYDTAPGDIELYPVNRVWEGANISSATTGRKDWTPNFYLQPNKLYWLVVGSAHAPVLSAVPMASCMAILGGSTSTFTAGPGIGWDVANTFGTSFPATFPAGATRWITNAHGIGLRFAND